VVGGRGAREAIASRATPTGPRASDFAGGDPMSRTRHAEPAIPFCIRLAVVSSSTGPPEGDGWLHEIKRDGHRFAASLYGRGGLKLISRKGCDRTPYSAVRSPSCARFAVRSFWTGIAVPDDRGVTYRPTSPPTSPTAARLGTPQETAAHESPQTTKRLRQEDELVRLLCNITSFMLH
jgi:hypothetical protein